MNLIAEPTTQFYSPNVVMKDSSTQTINVKKCNLGVTLPVTYDGANKEENDEIQTSHVYQTKNLPWRFEHPSKWNYGNAVFTCTDEDADKYSKKIDLPAAATWLRGYVHKREHPFYKTTNMDYGSKPPSVHTVPVTYFPVETKFTEHLLKCGMYRNRTLNTAMDRSKA